MKNVISLSNLVFLGRPIKPLAFAIAMSMATLFWYNIVLNTGAFHAGIIGDLVGAVAGASCVLLFAGWWVRSESVEQLGLLFATGVWITRTFFIGFLDGFSEIGVWLSACWALVVAATYFLEVTRNDRRGSARDRRGEASG
jgi:hypothetical protein